jgi:DNA-binding LytR/AlgR family response regulator
VLFTDKCQNFATDSILEAAFYIDTERGNYMKTIVVCDDVEIERLLLKEILCQYFEEINEEVSIVEYDSGETLIADVEEGYVAMDLLFLDIYMKKLNGMETARKLRQIQCKVPIIFLTASPDYAIESYEVQASGYLLKSFSEEKLMKLLNRILKTDMKRRVAIKNRRQYRYPCTDDIMYIDSDKHNVTLHLSDGSEIITVDKLGEIEKRINEKRFLRCHQSYLVNMDYIKDVEDDFIMEDGTLVPIRVRGRKEILDTYYDYFVNHFGDSKDNFAE